MKIAKTIWDIFVIIMSLVITGVLLYVVFRLLTMGSWDYTMFELSMKTGGAGGCVDFWLRDVSTAIRSIIY